MGRNQNLLKYIILMTYKKPVFRGNAQPLNRPILKIHIMAATEAVFQPTTDVHELGTIAHLDYGVLGKYTLANSMRN